MIDVPSGKLTIGYWNCRGLGAPLRMMATYAQLDYVDKQYEVVRAPVDSYQHSASTVALTLTRSARG